MQHFHFSDYVHSAEYLVRSAIYSVRLFDTRSDQSWRQHTELGKVR